MLSIKKYFLILVAIFALGLFLRLYHIGNIPSGFQRDEVFLGYNAYSLLKTGRDINGHLLPLHLASFLYTPAGYSYISIPFIALFGLSEFSVRFASALFGGLTIILLYIVVKQILTSIRINRLQPAMLEAISLIAAFLLSIAPWHINLSRTASVSTLVAFFILLGFYFFLCWVKNKKFLLLLVSFIFFGFSLTFYISAYSFLPLFLLLLFFYFRKSLPKHETIHFFALYILLLVPIIFTVVSPTLSLRIHSLSLMEDPGLPIVLTADASTDGIKGVTILATRLLHNKYEVVLSQFVINYFKHLSYDFIFSDVGYPDRYRIPEVGLFYPILLPFILAGWYISIRRNWKIHWLLIGWIAISPIGSGFARDDIPNIQRTLLTLFPIIILSSFGIYQYIVFIKQYNKLFQYACNAILMFIFLYEIIFYFHQYYIHASLYRPWYRQDGYKGLVAAVLQQQKNYQKFVITNRESGPTLFFLFYTAYDPSKFQSETKVTTMHDFDRIGFSNYDFSQEECPLQQKIDSNGNPFLTGKKGTLYVNSGNCQSVSGTQEIKTIYRSDNSPVFRLVVVK